MRQYPLGISLLLTIFVMSAILVAALSASAIILRELKVTGASDRGIQAFYMAESALEDSLYEFRQKGTTSLTIDEGNAVIMGNGKWWRTSSLPVTSFNATLLENQVAEITLFDPNDATSQAQSISLTWNINPVVCPGADFTWLEVVQSYWDGETQSTRRMLSKDEVGDAINISGTYPSVRLRALYGDACNLTMNAYQGANGTGGNFDLPAQLQVMATSEVSDTRQALSITVPLQAAQFGAFDYTIFSEQPICKDVSPCD